MISFQFSSFFLCSEMVFGLLYVSTGRNERTLEGGQVNAAKE